MFGAISAGKAASQETLSGKALAEALRKGGYNIYFRHAATNWTQQDRVIKAGDWEGCDPEPVDIRSRDRVL